MLKYGDIHASIKVSDYSEQCHNMSCNNNDVSCSSPFTNVGLNFCEDNDDSAGSTLEFSKKGLHIVSLNIQHFLPKLDEIKYILLSEKFNVDVIGFCEKTRKVNINR